MRPPMGMMPVVGPMGGQMLAPSPLVISMTTGYLCWLVVIVSMRVAYDPLLAPLSPAPAKVDTVPSSNITAGCIATESLITCLERAGVNGLWTPQEADPPQKSVPDDVVTSTYSATIEQDLMLLLPLLILNGAFAYAGTRPKARRPKQSPCPPQGGKETLRKQFAYLHSAETLKAKAMRRSNSVKHHTPARRNMASANRGALKGGC